MDVRNLFMADAEPQDLSAPRGGLAPTMVGGLSKFVGNVTKGIEKVMSHPLYARAWSGAVSGMAGDPMAGPRALAELRAQNAPSLEDELNRYRLRKAQRDEEQAEREAEARDRLRQSLMSGDQRSEYDPMIDIDPTKVWEQRNAPQKGPNLKVIDTPQGPKYVPADQAVGQAPYYRPPNSALQITGYDDEGRPLLQVGGAPVTNSTRSKIEGKELDAQDTLARLESIRRQFRPEFQQWGTKMAQRWLQMKDSAGVGLSETERSQLSELVKFQGAAYENMSLILNQLSGAAISPAEFDRLKRFLPNVGSGIFDGDSPTELQSKLDGFENSVKAVLKRYEIAKGRGTGSDPFNAPLSDFMSPDQAPGGQPSVQPPDGVPTGSTQIGPGLWQTPDGRYLAED